MRVLGLDALRRRNASDRRTEETRIIASVRRAPGVRDDGAACRRTLADLEKESGTRCCAKRGVMIGRPNSVVKGAHHSAELHGLRYEMLTAGDVRARFPALRPESDMVALWEPRAGVLFADACIAAHLAQARRCGAVLHYDEPMLRWEPEGDGVRVLTAQGEYRARQLIYCRAVDQRSVPDCPPRGATSVVLFDDAGASRCSHPSAAPFIMAVR